MKTQTLLGIWVATAVLAAGMVRAAEARVGHVFIVSIDQGNPDLIRETDLPVLNSWVEEGAHTWGAFTIVPSVTLPSHVSMLTGVGVQKHQLTWNSYEPDRGAVRVPTVFSLARERGFVTAMFVGKEKLKHIQLPGSVDHFEWPQPEDDARAVAAAFATAVGALKPNLCFIHFRDPDTVGHKYGAYSPEKTASLRRCDEALRTIRQAIAEAGLLADSVIIVTADHGGHDVLNEDGNMVGTHGSAESADVTIPWIAWGKGVRPGYTITEPVVLYDTAATALWLLGVPLPESFWGRPVKSAFDGYEGGPEE